MPDVKEIRPAYIKGLKREFSLWDPLGFTETNLDVAGEPFCALDIHLSTDKNQQVNGVCFEVSERYFENLLIREQEYELIQTEGFDFFTDKTLGTVFAFSANKRNGHYYDSSKAQQRYLEVCLQGAKDFGEDFYEEFLASTLLDGEPLSAFLERLNY